MDSLDQGPEFMDMLLQEIHEYLAPDMALNDDLLSDLGSAADEPRPDLEEGEGECTDPDYSVGELRGMVP